MVSKDTEEKLEESKNSLDNAKQALDEPEPIATIEEELSETWEKSEPEDSGDEHLLDGGEVEIDWKYEWTGISGHIRVGEYENDYVLEFVSFETEPERRDIMERLNQGTYFEAVNSDSSRYQFWITSRNTDQDSLTEYKKRMIRRRVDNIDDGESANQENLGLN